MPAVSLFRKIKRMSPITAGFFAFAILLGHPAYGDVVLNEVMSSNVATVADEDGDYPDWIEITNTGGEAVNLSGYGLTDDADTPFEWVFPSTVLPSGGHIVVFASDKDRTVAPGYFDALVTRGDSLRYVVPSSAMPATWAEAGFDDSAWLEGTSGIGYGDSDDATGIEASVRNLALSCFTRTTFVVEDPTTITSAWLHIDYDDSFVAYINGVEIARANIGTAGIPVDYTTEAKYSHEAIMYTGNQPEMFTIEAPSSLLVAGENVLAIQVHNDDINSSDMTLIGFLTVSMSTPPANPRGLSDVLTLVQPKLHANFKIGSQGDTIILTDPQSATADSVDTGLIPADHSLGRSPDGSGDWVFFAVPTPEEANAASGFTDFAQTVNMSLNGGFYSSAVSVTFATEDESGEIRYTLDGAEPSDSSTVYTGTFTVDQTTVVKARNFQTGLLPGPVAVNTYFINSSHTIPVFSISTAPANLWDNLTGIYVLGPDPGKSPYKPTATTQGANFWQDWEIPVNVELFEADGSFGFSQAAGVKILGGYLRRFPQKSLGIYARNRYGSDTINYQLFPDLPYTEYSTFMLRNGGNDFEFTYLRSSSLQQLIKGLDLDTQANRAAIVYLNGEYWGLQPLHEKENEEYIARHYGFAADNIDILETDLASNDIVIAGDNTHFMAMIDYINTHDMSTAESYAYIQTQIDMSNFLDYMVSNIYIGNWDWPHNNMKYWRPRTPDGKWRWLTFDLDFCFGWKIEAQNNSKYTFDTLNWATTKVITDRPNVQPIYATVILNKLLTNQDFKNEFINRFSDYMNTIFLPANVTAHLDKYAGEIAPEMQRHGDKWGGTAESGRDIKSYEDWAAKVSIMYDYGNNRPSYMRTFLTTKFGLSPTAQLTVDLSDSSAGSVKLTAITPDSFPWTGTYFTGVPMTITATPQPGYRFVRWNGTDLAASAAATLTLSADTAVTAVFEKTGGANRMVINEINYNSLAEHETGDWIEIYNPGGVQVDLGDWVIKDDDDAHVFTIPTGTIVEPWGYLVVCRDLAAFRTKYPTAEPAIGNLSFGLGNSGDTVRLFTPLGALSDSVAYLDTAPWPVAADGEGKSLSLLNPVLDNGMPYSWAASASYGTPCAKNDVFIVSVEDAAVPTAFAVQQNFPNPFNPETTIIFDIPTEEHVTVEVYSVLGQRVATLVDQRLVPGRHRAVFAAGDLSAGIYFCRVSAGSHSTVRRMVLMK